MKRVVIVLVLLVVLGLAGFAAYWQFDLRWRPAEIRAADAPRVEAMLQRAGWVSPRLNGPTLYMVSFRDCPTCIRYEREQFPALQAAGVDTRVIMFVRDQEAGAAETSTVFERSTVAELWLNRDWSLYQRWMRTTPPSAWTAPGIVNADTDGARNAVVQGTRNFVDELRPLLSANGVAEVTPILVWRTREGTLRACGCGDERQWRHIRSDLGVNT